VKVLITGGTGFLGSHLVSSLLDCGNEIIVLKRSTSNISRISSIIKRIITYDIDIVDLEIPFRENREIDAIIHTATSYGRDENNIDDIIKSNIVFPARLLESGCIYRIPFFFNTDTFFDADDLSYNYLPAYSLSKKQFLEWGMHVARRKVLRFINLKVFHMYGPGDNMTKFTMYVVSSFLQNVEEVKFTEGTQKRDFIHVKDVVSAYSLLLEKRNLIPNYFQNFEVGSGKAIPVREFVETAHRVTGSSTIVKFGALPMREGEFLESKAKNDSLKTFGWIPKMDIENGIKTLIDDLKEWRL
jgi:nucleoside-diphosphate-sugar epimerase